jgi:two-component system response regulator LytT
MRIVICEDQQFYAASLQKCIDRWSKNNEKNDIVVDLFTSAEDLLDVWDRHLNYDLAFLDIMMPDGLNGLDLARRIRELDNRINIVFVTNNQGHVFDGYSVEALRYFSKPFSEKDIFEVLEIVQKKLAMEMGHSILLPLKYQTIVLSLREILYAEAYLHSVNVYRASDLKCLEAKLRISDMREKLKGTTMIQCHRGYLVNLMYVRGIQKKALRLTTGQEIPVGNNYTQEVYKAFFSYFVGR